MVNSLSGKKDEELFNAIKDAISIYNLLGENEKAQVSNEYEILKSSVSSYNKNAELQNSEHATANENALNVFVGTISCLAALAYLLKRKML